jgi:hypothetical protein
MERGRRVITLALCLGLCAGPVLTTACTDPADDAPVPQHSASARHVTVAEAERLATVRFRNFDAGTRTVDVVYTDQGHHVRIDGVVDYRTHTGFATLTSDGHATDSLVWDGQRIAISPDGPWSGSAAPDSVDGWTLAPLDGSTPVGAVLTVLASLGADRPENPLLLRQGGALWLREDTIRGTPVTVFAGPTAPVSEDGSPAPDDTVGTGDRPIAPPSGAPPADDDGDRAGLRYWVDEDGLALRVEVRLGQEWATIDLGERGDTRVPPLPDGAEPAPVRSPPTRSDERPPVP